MLTGWFATNQLGVNGLWSSDPIKFQLCIAFFLYMAFHLIKFEAKTTWFYVLNVNVLNSPTAIDLVQGFVLEINTKKLWHIKII